jgi:hypothetical protein
MNLELREQIVKHILANLAIIPSTYVALDKSKSLKGQEFLLPEKINFQDEHGHVLSNKLWGCQFAAEQQELKILLVDCSTSTDIPEYAVLVSLKNQPMYGVYLVDNSEVESEALIAVSLNGKDWLEANTYIQSTFLSAMENIKSMGLAWSKCQEYQDNLSHLLQFIKFHSYVYGE